ncbi:hypothetical protein AAFO90_16900 [Phaeobacter sp. CAU 1743]|uniref:hypothetical protein n=1 Tax=Phaeobacter sp. CAU 1743 TaxID=3140367 RepID=UPI00325AD6D1
MSEVEEKKFQAAISLLNDAELIDLAFSLICSDGQALVRRVQANQGDDQQVKTGKQQVGVPR